ncbi:3-oxoacyl-ACP synthase [Marinoscillum sp. MHG1-6]|uniref:3-oxoacyl-ACP synthase n=1 Tax=Marinoscillum sp. MHG1-6 TaxID=2959627 RepID=UPI0021579E06|nr:3-oxoacyl-ACP synthase [Marinoscillum sp. MHG1-6]
MMEVAGEKGLLMKRCEEILNERIDKAKQEIQSYSEQSGEETKSSAGDKYETTRAMLNLEKEKIAMQLDESLKLKRALDQLKGGKLLKTNKGNFFISVGIGSFSLEGENYFAISPVAPIGKLLSTAKVGDSVAFGPNTYQVLEVVD